MNPPHSSLPPIPEGWSFWGEGPLPLTQHVYSPDIGRLKRLDGGKEYWDIATSFSGAGTGIYILRDNTPIRGMCMACRASQSEPIATIVKEQPPIESTQANATQYGTRNIGGEIAEKAAEAFAESDPHGLSPHTPGAKLDAGKPMVGLLLGFSRALEAVSEVATYGAGIYTENGWEAVRDGEKRYMHAAGRHLLKMLREPVDPKSGYPHLWHIAWNVLAWLELHERNKS